MGPVPASLPIPRSLAAGVVCAAMAVGWIVASVAVPPEEVDVAVSADAAGLTSTRAVRRDAVLPGGSDPSARSWHTGAGAAMDTAGDAEGPEVVVVEPQPVTVTDPAALADEAAGVLPGDVPEKLSGDLVVVPGNEQAPGSGGVTTIRVEVERGLPVDAGLFARFVMETLNDPRGWGADGSRSFARTDTEADLRVVLASAGTVDQMCAPLATNGQWSCGRYGHAALNANRWFFGSEAFVTAGGDLTEYRRYLLNHEIGHLIGQQHVGCPAPGALAPIMLQQSIGLQGCVPNGWPNP